MFPHSTGVASVRERASSIRITYDANIREFKNDAQRVTPSNSHGEAQIDYSEKFMTCVCIYRLLVLLIQCWLVGR